jgi:hypothetical protein
MAAQVTQDRLLCRHILREVVENPACIDAHDQMAKAAELAGATGLAQSRSRVSALCAALAGDIDRAMPGARAAGLLSRAHNVLQRVDRDDATVLREAMDVAAGLCALSARMQSDAACPRELMLDMAAIVQPLVIMPLAEFCYKNK